MIYRLICTALLLIMINGFDYYILRHGARAPLQTTLINVFGVEAQQLTPAGRSEAFYGGKELRLRHPQITSIDMLVYSTNVNHTKQTAEYFLKGWHDFSGEINQTKSQINMPLQQFEANPKFLPPIRISFNAKLIRRNVRKNTYSSIVKPIPMVLQHMIKSTVPQLHSRQQIEIEERMKKSNLCQKVEKFAPGICQKRPNATNAFFYISDLITCLNYQKMKIPGVTRADEQLAHSATDITYGKRFDRVARPESPVLNFFALFKRYAASVGEKKLFLEFTHDTFILGLIRAIIGYEGFKAIIGRHLIIPFLSVVRFRVRDGTIRMFFNDRELQLSRCYQPGQTSCSIKRFMEMIDISNF